ncbi:MAG TPA: DinB family protein [Ignavibacteriaceae bacterium]|nr:DinB family protein [Ignavibacteriaceae bacterium]
MKEKIKEIINKYDNVYKGNPWYGTSIIKILNKVDPATVFLKADKHSHSIAELLAHIIGWRENGLNNLIGKSGDKIKQKETFNWKRFNKNEKTAWKSLLRALDKNQKDIISFLRNKNDGYLLGIVPGRKFNMEFLIDGIIQHDIYHLGQIGILNKILTP